MRCGDAQAISARTSDMSRCYLPAIGENIPNSISIIDKFHVKKGLMDEFDNVSKEEQKTAYSKVELFRGRCLFIVPKDRLTEAQLAKLNSLSKLFPKTGRAFSIVAAIYSFYACQTMENAERAFDGICPWMRRCRLQPTIDLVLIVLRVMHCNQTK